MPINPIRYLRLYLSMLNYGHAHNLDLAREHAEFFREMRQRLPNYGIDDLQGLRVLDVGCGKAFWLTLLLHSCGALVTGIDTEFLDHRRGPWKYIGILRNNGLERSLRTLTWDMAYRSSYYRKLQDQFQFTFNFDGVDIKQGSVTNIDFPDNTFDLVVSHEVFEHISDVPAAVRNLQQMMKPEAITYIYIHNYTSISGGHHIAWKYPDTEPSPIVPPWDHLRQNRYPDISSKLNKLREHEYEQIFKPRFETIDWIRTCSEGKDFLTPEIRGELNEYTREELLTKGFIIIARPKK